MKKKKFEDIIPADKRSIRNIPLLSREDKAGEPKVSMDGIHHARHSNVERSAKANAMPKASPARSSRKVKVNIENEVERPEKFAGYLDDDLDVIDEKPASYKELSDGFDDEGGDGKSRWKAWLLIIIVLGSLGYFLSVYFAYAEINITLAKHDVTLANASIPLGKLNYTVASSEISKTVTVQANGVQKVSRNAGGTVVIYNTANSTSQPLSINTRLQIPDGKIFKTDKAVTVPPAKTVNGKKVPGSVEVEVTADQPGDAYNVGLKDFTIFGFKGTDKYTIFYARAKTPMAGGFVGNVPNVSQSDLANTATALKKSAADETLASIASKLKDGSSQSDDYVYIPNGSIVEYSAPDTKLAKDGKSADVTVTAKITALAISNSSLARFLVQSDTTPHDTPESGNQFTTGSYSADFSKLKIDLPSSMTSKALIALTNASDTDTVITATGVASVSSLVDDAAITSAISRLSKTQAVDVIKGIVDFQTIDISVKPWWAGSLPSADKIKINIEQ